MAEATTKKAKESKDNYVPVFIPLIEGEDESQFVGVGDKTFKIAKGETVLVPPEVAEVLEHSRIQMNQARKNAKKMQEEGQEIQTL